MFRSDIFVTEETFLDDNSPLQRYFEVHKTSLSEVYFVKVFIHSGLDVPQTLVDHLVFITSPLCYHFSPYIFLREGEVLESGRFSSPNGRYILDVDSISTKGLQMKDTDRNDAVFTGNQVPFDGISIEGGTVKFILKNGGVSMLYTKTTKLRKARKRM